MRHHKDPRHIIENGIALLDRALDRLETMEDADAPLPALQAYPFARACEDIMSARTVLQAVRDALPIHAD